MLAVMWVTPCRATEFRIAVGIDPDTMDPVQQTTTTVGNMVDYVVETLTKLVPDGSIQPFLAESWSVSPDGLQYTFKLRQGVTFHDQTPFNTAAVKWNFDRLKDPEMRVTLKRPYVPFISALSSGTAGILSPASAEQHGSTYKNYTHIVGTGPYVFQERKIG
jgi:peptide/nickel transport system substrate-binding protein